MEAAPAEIPFWVYDRPKWVSGITSSTSCEDILKSLSAFLPEKDVHVNLILTEKWRDVERPLSAEAKILKIWTAWGDEQKFVKFVLKRVSQRSIRENHRKRLRRRGSVSSVDELHPRGLVKTSTGQDHLVKTSTGQDQNDQEKDVIEEMMKIIEIQRKVITEELMKAKRKAKKGSVSSSNNTTPQKELKDTAESKKIKVILDEMLKLTHLNDKLQFAEESVDRLQIAIKQQQSSSSTEAQAEDKLIQSHLACAKTEVSRLRTANDKAAFEVKDNQKALDKMEEAKAERKLALKRLEYDVNVIEKEGRKLAKEYEKVLSIKIDDIIEEPSKESDEDENEEEIYDLLNNSSSSSSLTKTDQENNSTTSGHSSAEHSIVQDIIAKESPIDEKNVNSNQDENNSDTGLSSLHTSSDEGTYDVGTLV